MRYFWAFVLISFGVGIIGTGLGWWNNDIWTSIWRFWPLILIFIGLDLLTRDLALQPIIMIGALIVAGIFVYDVAVSTNPVLNRSEITSRTVTESALSATLSENAKRAFITVETGAVDFSVDGGTDKLFDGNLSSNVSKADITSSTTNDSATATISTPNIRDFWVGMTNLKNQLTLALTRAVPLDLTVNTGASKLNLDLSENQISNLTVKAGASSIFARLGDKTVDNANVNIDAGASSIEIQVPKSYAVSVKSDSGLSSHDLQGFTRSENTWTTTENESNAKKIQINIKSGVSSIRVVRN